VAQAVKLPETKAQHNHDAGDDEGDEKAGAETGRVTVAPLSDSWGCFARWRFRRYG
jgi:hypothetical protein